MPLRLLKTRTLPIGIDLGTAVLKLAQVRCAEGDYQLVSAAAVEIPQGCRDAGAKRTAFLVQNIRQLVRANPFTGRQCIMALPAASTFIQHVKTGKLPSAELDKALRWELEGKLPFDAGDAVIRHLVAGETYNEREAGLEVIVVAVARRVVEDHLDLARRAGLKVVGLDVECCAILECFARLFRRPDDAKRVNLFLDFGHANTQVVIGHGNRLVFTRNLTIGARQLDEAAAAILKLSPEEIRLARQKLAGMPDPRPEADCLYDAVTEGMETMSNGITKCLRYYESVFPSAPVERAIFLGGQATDRRLCARIAQRLNLPAQIGDPLARIARSQTLGTETGLDRRQAQPAWAVAVGLSLSATLGQAA